MDKERKVDMSFCTPEALRKKKLWARKHLFPADIPKIHPKEWSRSEFNIINSVTNDTQINY